MKSAAAEGEIEAQLQVVLQNIASAFEAQTATLHRAEIGDKTLHMVACQGIPEKLIPITKMIPFGKGMAGICAERLSPVSVCNLQTDDSGVARPAARETGVAGAIVVPVLSGGDELVGTLGIGKAGEYEYSEKEVESLLSCARVLASVL